MLPLFPFAGARLGCGRPGFSFLAEAWFCNSNLSLMRRTCPEGLVNHRHIAGKGMPISFEPRKSLCEPHGLEARSARDHAGRHGDERHDYDDPAAIEGKPHQMAYHVIAGPTRKSRFDQRESPSMVLRDH
jgi:hypothetical protein